MEPVSPQPAESNPHLTTKELCEFIKKVFENNQSLCTRADQKLAFAFAVATGLTGALLPLLKPTLNTVLCAAYPTWMRIGSGGLGIVSLFFAGRALYSIYQGVSPAGSKHPNLTGARGLVYGEHIIQRGSNADYLSEIRELTVEGELVEWVNQAYEVGHIEAQKMRRAKAALRALMFLGMVEFCAWAFAKFVQS